MLEIHVPAGEQWDEIHNEFVSTKACTLRLEHSLVSISKWEAKWHKSFFDNSTPKTTDEVIDYIRCMTLTQNVDPNVYRCLSSKNHDEINKYINDDATATWFSETPGKKNKKRNSRQKITSELVYYWMIALSIPFECQKWHINRLLTLIRVCEEENAPKQKMSQKSILSRNAALNAARRKKLGTKG